MSNWKPNLSNPVHEGKECSEGGCIFCGETLEHFNDGGKGWALFALVDGETKEFFYCDQPPCDEADKHYEEVYRCYHTSASYVEFVGDTCPDCGGPAKEHDQ